MSCFVMYTPYHLAESDWDSASAKIWVIPFEATLEEFFPGFGKLVEHREVVTPLDIERVVGLSEGNIFAGEMFSSPDVFESPSSRLESISHSDSGILPMRLGHPPRRWGDGRSGQTGGQTDPQRPLNGNFACALKGLPHHALSPEFSGSPCGLFKTGNVAELDSLWVRQKIEAAC